MRQGELNPPPLFSITDALQVYQDLTEYVFHAVVAGDSTFDNEAWVGGGKEIVYRGRAYRENWSKTIVENFLQELAKITNQLAEIKKINPHEDKSEEKGLQVPALSIEQYVKVRLALLAVKIKLWNGSCDGATTQQMLGGLIRGSVFGENPRRLPPVTYRLFDSILDSLPSEDSRIPYTDGVGIQLQSSGHTGLTIGGNNFRVYLYIIGQIMQHSRWTATRILKGNTLVRFALSEYWSKAYDHRLHLPGLFDLIKETQNDICNILDKTLAKHQDLQSTVSLWVLYHISYMQETHRFYEILRFVGEAFKWGDELDAIHILNSLLYVPIIQHFSQHPRVVIVDPTHTMNPFDTDSYVSQIEPSGKASMILGDQYYAVFLHYFRTRFLAAINWMESVLPTSLLKLVTEYYGVKYGDNICLPRMFVFSLQEEKEKNNEKIKSVGKISASLSQQKNIEVALHILDKESSSHGIIGNIEDENNVLLRETVEGWHPCHPKEFFVKEVLQLDAKIKSLASKISNPFENSKRVFYQLDKSYTDILQAYTFSKSYLPLDRTHKVKTTIIPSMLLIALLAQTSASENSVHSILLFTVRIVQEVWQHLIKKEDNDFFNDDAKLGEQKEPYLRSLLRNYFNKQWQEPEAIQLLQHLCVKKTLDLATNPGSLLYKLNFSMGQNSVNLFSVQHQRLVTAHKNVEAKLNPDLKSLLK